MTVNIVITYGDIDPYVCYECKAQLGDGVHNMSLAICICCAQAKGIAGFLKPLIIPAIIRRAWFGLMSASGTVEIPIEAAPKAEGDA